jgi:UDP-glucose 4-epimerase
VEQRRSLWVLGGGGFLGSSLIQQARNLGFHVFTHDQIPWDLPTARSHQLASLSREFAHFSKGSDTVIIWAAGSQGVLESKNQISSELDSFNDFAKELISMDALHGSTIAIVSSAGGVYGGSSNPPYCETSEVNAINQYGRDKIAIEELARARLSPFFLVHVARITNLYGPWHGPRQGLINRMCTAAANREGLHIYVPLDTVRDYIDVSDAAKLLFPEISKTRAHDQRFSISVIGSGESSSIGSVINTISHVTHRKVPISLAQLAETQLQPRDLRVRPSWLDNDPGFSPIKLAEGVKNLFDSLVTVPRWN